MPGRQPAYLSVMMNRGIGIVGLIRGEVVLAAIKPRSHAHVALAR